MKKTARIIIEVCDCISEVDALGMVQNVISKGKISERRGHKQYCFASTWYDRENMKRLVVYCREKKHKDYPDSFIVYSEKATKEEIRKAFFDR